jgi:hypothetical protein
MLCVCTRETFPALLGSILLEVELTNGVSWERTSGFNIMEWQSL